MMFGRAVMQSGLALALIGVLAISFWHREHFTRARKSGDAVLRTMLLITIVLWLPGLLESVDWFRSFKVWARTFVFIGVAALIWSILRKYGAARMLALKAFVVSAVITTSLACISVWFWPELIKVLRNMDEEVLRPNLWLKSFGASCVCFFPVLIWAGRRLGGHWRWPAFIAAALCVAVIFETANRAAMAGLLAMILIGGTLLAIRDKRTRLPVLAGAPIFVALIFFWLLNYGPTFLSPEEAYLPTILIDPHRQMIWKFTVERGMDALWFGHGLDTINYQPGASPSNGEHAKSLIPSHPHNWMIEVFAETGVLGLLAVIATLLKLVVGLARSVLANNNTGVHFALLALSVVFWTSALFNFSIWSTWWLLTYFVLFAIVSSFKDTQPD